MIVDENGRPLVAVHTCYKDVEASLIISYLEAYGISAQANSDIPHSVLPVTVGKLGKIRILVNQDDADEARELLAEAREGRLHPERE